MRWIREGFSGQTNTGLNFTLPSYHGTFISLSLNVFTRIMSTLWWGLLKIIYVKHSVQGLTHVYSISKNKGGGAISGVGLINQEVLTVSWIGNTVYWQKWDYVIQIGSLQPRKSTTLVKSQTLEKWCWYFTNSTVAAESTSRVFEAQRSQPCSSREKQLQPSLSMLTAGLITNRRKLTFSVWSPESEWKDYIFIQLCVGRAWKPVPACLRRDRNPGCGRTFKFKHGDQWLDCPKLP